MIGIVSLEEFIPRQGFDVVINEGPLQNRYKDRVNENYDSQDAYIDYKYYFDIRLKNDKRFLNELRRLYRIHKKYGKLRLFCIDVSIHSHALVVREFLMRYCE